MKMKRLLAALLAVLTLLTAVPSVFADEISAEDALSLVMGEEPFGFAEEDIATEDQPQIVIDVAAESETKPTDYGTVFTLPPIPNDGQQVKPITNNLPLSSYKSATSFSSWEKVVPYLREKMVARVQHVTVSFPCGASSSEISSAAQKIVNKTLEYTGKPDEGTYLRYHSAVDASIDDYDYNNNTVVLTFNMDYHSTQAQEQAVTARANQLIAEKGWKTRSMTTYQKLKEIYDWVCQNVVYDNEHVDNSNYRLQFTAYAALINHTAVCQGYATLFYYLAVASGLEVQVLSGDGYSGVAWGGHAWNIACIDGWWYNLDATWDSQYVHEGLPYKWFLLCPNNFDARHKRDEESKRPECPMSPVDYNPENPPAPHPSVAPLATPKLTSATANSQTSITVKWGAVSGAAKYRVYYKGGGKTSWTKLKDTTSTSYTWTGAKAGTTYTFTVKAYSEDGKRESAYDTKGVSVTTPKAPSTTLATPKISSVKANSQTSITVKWGAVSGAAKYRVFYKGGGKSSWTKLADTTSTSYTWKKAKAGTKYSFTVRCLDKNGKYASSYDKTGKSVTTPKTASKTLSTPKISNITKSGTKITVKWGKVSGAAKYRVFYKTDLTGGWKKLKDTTSTSCSWTGKSGHTYSFTVRCLNKSGKYVSAYDTTGKTITLGNLKTPSVKAANVSGGVKISWGKVTGAEKYRVFYKGGGVKSWKKLKDTTGTSYTWTGAKAGTKYTFTVRCLSADGKKYTSKYNTTGKSVTTPKATTKTLATPKLSSVTANSSTSITVKWGAVSGAAKYRVFYKGGGKSGWTKLADTTSTSYTWKSAKAGTKYTFTVRCLSADGKKYTSKYNTTGKSVTTPKEAVPTLATPELTSVKANNPTTITLTWKEVPGAVRYRVFYKGGGKTSWTQLDDSYVNSYKWRFAKSVTTYTFTVRCVSGDGTTYLSGYDKTGMSVTTPQAVNLRTPKILNVNSGSVVENGVEKWGYWVDWTPVDGAEAYRIFWRAEGQDWSEARSADVSDSLGVRYFFQGTHGTTYYLTIRCIDGAGNYTSDYDTTGYEFYYFLY